MKVICYQRHEQSKLHRQSNASASCLYIPDENVLLFKEKRGMFGATDYSLAMDTDILEEAKAVEQETDNFINKKGVVFSNIHTISYDKRKVVRLIKKILTKHTLEPVIKCGIEGILEKADMT